MRYLKILCVQLGNHHSSQDKTTLTHRGFRSRDSMGWSYVSYEPGTYSDGLYYVASFLLQQYPNIKIDICQMLWGDNPYEFPIESYDYILVSGLGTHFWSNITTMAEIKRRKSTSSTIIMGGPHATFAPYEALKYVDFVIMGEGEVPTAQLIACLETGGNLDEVDNLCYIGDDGLLVMNNFKRYGNINNIINPSLLQTAPSLPWAPISMSRGCPFNCSFCYAVRLLGSQFRPKNIDDIRQEIDGISEQTGCTHFLVTDLNFATRKEFCEDVARAFHHSRYKFIALNRVEIADDIALVRALKEAGFEQYYFGVESDDPGVLQAFNKRVEAAQQTERLRKMAENDIFVHAGLIFGLESQDEDAMLRTARWCAEAQIVHPNFYCLTDYPFQKMLFGSRQDIEDHRIIMETTNYQHFSFVGIYPRHMRPSQLQRILVKCFKDFFERAFEVENRPKRRVRLKAFARLKANEFHETERHIALLEELEKPYYTPFGELKEDLLKADFEARYGHIREWLGKSINKRNAQIMMELPT